MSYLISKYKGTYRLLTEFDRTTNDFPRDLSGNFSDNDIYIKCANKIKVFYVGKGSGDRAWKKEGRNEFWKKVVNKHGYDVEIHSNHLQEWYAFELERDLIAYYGRRQLGLGTLVNLSDGGEGTGGWVPSQEFIDFRRKIMQREDAPNKDKTVWTFKNLKTGEEVSATRHQFRQTHPEVLVNTICTSDGSSYDWVVIENQTEFSMQAKINNYKGIYNPVSDKTKYSITNVNTLEVFVGLRSELSDKIGCDAGPLVRKEHNVSMGVGTNGQVCFRRYTT
jgi:hypothetical protein